MISTHNYKGQYSSEEERDNAKVRVLRVIDRLLEENDFEDEYSQEEYEEDGKFVLEINYTINK
jgi:hypothetical protein